MEKLTRRDFLCFSAMAAAGVAAVACQPQTVVVKETVEVEKVVKETVEVEKVVKETVEVPMVVAASPHESSTLQSKVKAGELPPLEERIPTEPLVIEPIERIGVYGGTLRMVTPVPNDYDDMDTMNTEGLLRFASSLKDIEPNILKGWDLTTDAKDLTLQLRPGMKWSDGDPFTADDIMFWYQDFLLNVDLTPTISVTWKPGGEPVQVEKVDDYTVGFHFAAPYAVVLNRLAHSNGFPNSIFFPAHYLQQFHPNYVAQADLDKAAQAEGFDYWYQLFLAKRTADCGQPFENTEYPGINCFHLTEKTPGYWTLDRNPYYWKTDPEGNQLPYIEGAFLTLVEDREMVASKVATGEVDYAAKETKLVDYPLYTQNAQAGRYRVLLWKSIFGGDCIYQFNQTLTNDMVMGDLSRDVRFRQAMSLAIDRQDISDAIYYGKAIPRQWTVIPECSYYEERFAEAYAEYDPDEANRLLDELGLDKRDSAGFRLRSDGKRLAFTVEYYPVESPKTAISEIVREHWGAVGVDVTLKEISGELSAMRYPANEVAVGAWHGDKSTDILFPIAPQFFVPYSHGWETTWGPEWAQWYITGGEEGVEPPDEVKDLYTWWEKLQQTTDAEERIALGKQILASQAENLWCIGTVGCGPIPAIVRDNLRNVPEEIYYGWDTLFGYYAQPQQWFFAKE